MVISRRTTAVIGAAALVAAAGVGTAAAAGGLARTASGPSASAAAMTTGPAPQSAIFTDSCRPVKVANDDPLLLPGRPGAAMQHDFFGNQDVTASSTATTLRGGPSSCSTSADASAYWTPVLSQHGQALQPVRTLVYWRTPGTDAATTVTMPAGISMIAGDEAATAPQQRQVRWQCVGGSQAATPRSSATPRSCQAGEQVRLVVTFPSCWDGKTLNGAAQTNVVYPTGRSCPSDHAVRIPQVIFHETYPTASAEGLTLSMGPGQQGSTDTAHVDFVNGWDQRAFDSVFRTCVTGGRACGQVRGPDATPAHPQDLTPPRQPAGHHRAH